MRTSCCALLLRRMLTRKAFEDDRGSSTASAGLTIRSGPEHKRIRIQNVSPARKYVFETKWLDRLHLLLYKSPRNEISTANNRSNTKLGSARGHLGAAVNVCWCRFPDVVRRFSIPPEFNWAHAGPFRPNPNKRRPLHLTSRKPALGLPASGQLNSELIMIWLFQMAISWTSGWMLLPGNPQQSGTDAVVGLEVTYSRSAAMSEQLACAR